MSELFLPGEFCLGSEQCQMRGWDDAGKMRLFLLPFFVRLLSNCLFHWVAVDSRAFPELFLLVVSCLIIDLHGEMEAGVSYPILMIWPIMVSFINIMMGTGMIILSFFCKIHI